MNRAQERGKAQARYALRMEAKNVFVGCENPYKREQQRRDWQAGFESIYYKPKGRTA